MSALLILMILNHQSRSRPHTRTGGSVTMPPKLEMCYDYAPPGTPRWDKYPWWPYRYDFAVKRLESEPNRWRKRKSDTVQYYKLPRQGPSKTRKYYFVAFKWYPRGQACWSTRDELIAAFCSLLDCHKSVEVLVRELHALKLDPTTRAKMQEQSLLQEAKDLIHLWFTADSPGQCILDTALAYSQYLRYLSECEDNERLPHAWRPHRHPVTLHTIWNNEACLSYSRVAPHGRMSVLGFYLMRVINQSSSTGSFPMPPPMKQFQDKVIDMISKFKPAETETHMVQPPTSNTPLHSDKCEENSQPPLERESTAASQPCAQLKRNGLLPRLFRKQPHYVRLPE